MTAFLLVSALCLPPPAEGNPPLKQFEISSRPQQDEGTTGEEKLSPAYLQAAVERLLQYSAGRMRGDGTPDELKTAFGLWRRLSNTLHPEDRQGLTPARSKARSTPRCSPCSGCCG